MSGYLIPQQRMDKTGKLVTRHVLAAAPVASQKTVIPVPALTTAKPAQASKKKVSFKKPLAKQLETQNRRASLHSLKPDPEVLEALGITLEREFPIVSVVASDVEMYDMFAVVGTSNAVMMISSGKKTPEEAVELLESKGLGHLVVDRREMMDEAISRRINAWSFMQAPSKFDIDEFSCDPEQLLGAVRLEDSMSLPRWKTNGREDSYAHHVLNGDISYDDVMEMGISFLSNHGALGKTICGYLKDIHACKTDYDVDVLSHLASKCGNSGHMLDDAMGMVSEYGPDFMKEVKDMDFALRINREYRERPTSQRAAIIQYRQDGKWHLFDLGPKDIVKLFDNDIPVDTAKEMSEQKMSVDQIIAVHKEGIAKTVVSGWL